MKGSVNVFGGAGGSGTVNNGTLTIKRNNTQIGTFTANQASNTSVNIVVPTATSDLSNDSDFVTTTALETSFSSKSYVSQRTGIVQYVEEAIQNALDAVLAVQY